MDPAWGGEGARTSAFPAELRRACVAACQEASGTRSPSCGMIVASRPSHPDTGSSLGAPGK